VVVAQGDADAEYAFEVVVVVPPDLAPGPAELVAVLVGGGTASDMNERPGLRISDAPPTGAAATVADFSVADDDPPPAGEPEDDGLDPIWWWAAGASLTVLIAVGAVVLLRRRRLGTT
jgi:hypothetical protein